MTEGSATSFPAGPLTAQEELLVEGSSRRKCFTCRSTKLRPLIVLAKEGFPPGDSRHVITYSHDAIFGCDDCHHGYVELRRHDCFDFEEVFDQDQVCALDGDSITKLAQCLPGCPQPLAESCECKVHQSLRSSWKSLPTQVWDRYTGIFPGALMQMADPDQERIVLSGVCVEVHGSAPKLKPKNGKWQAFDAKGKLKAEGTFSNGLLKGRWTFWHENGRKRLEGEYVSDLREGTWTEWSDRGEVVAERVFRKGQPLKP